MLGPDQEGNRDCLALLILKDIVKMCRIFFGLKAHDSLPMSRNGLSERRLLEQETSDNTRILQDEGNPDEQIDLATVSIDDELNERQKCF